MKRICGLLLIVLTACSLCACGFSGRQEEASTAVKEKTPSVDVSTIKLGAIMVGDEKDPYTHTHLRGLEDMQEALGLSNDQIVIQTGIRNEEDWNKAVKDLAGQGCRIVFSINAEYEDLIIQAARDYPDVDFCQAAGFQASSSSLPNMHNYFVKIYESRYLSGLVAGLKLNQMIENGQLSAGGCKLGYVAAYPNAEVTSGFTAFFLGVRSVCASATMDVRYVNSWSSEEEERACANLLIDSGCVLLGHHTNSAVVPTVCEERGVLCTGYNMDVISQAPNQGLTSATSIWTPYYRYAVECVLNGKKIDTDWSGGYGEGSVDITPVNEAICAEGSKKKVKKAAASIKENKLEVFDTSTYTIKGKSLEELVEQGDELAKAMSAHIYGGYFHESEVKEGFPSSPAFTFLVDGITAYEE